MARKYIKGKDGKFQGSVSDGKAVPVAAPKLPLLHRESSEIDPDAQARMAAAILRRREALNKTAAEQPPQLLDEVTVDPKDS